MPLQILDLRRGSDTIVTKDGAEHDIVLSICKGAVEFIFYEDEGGV